MSVQVLARGQNQALRASLMAAMMFGYAAQRHKLPLMDSRISASL
jgi:hypothetical protein